MPLIIDEIYGEAPENTFQARLDTGDEVVLVWRGWTEEGLKFEVLGIPLDTDDNPAEQPMVPLGIVHYEEWPTV